MQLTKFKLETTAVLTLTHTSWLQRVCVILCTCLRVMRVRFRLCISAYRHDPTRMFMRKQRYFQYLIEFQSIVQIDYCKIVKIYCWHAATPYFLINISSSQMSPMQSPVFLKQEIINKNLTNSL